MLTLSHNQLAELDRLTFFARVRQFITRRCGQAVLREWASTHRDPPVWRAAWPHLASLSEHDAALLLVMVAVSECEGRQIGDVEVLAHGIGDHEANVKRFLFERGYFAPGEFDYCGPGAEAG